MNTRTFVVPLMVIAAFLLVGCSDTVNPVQPAENSVGPPGTLSKAIVLTINTTIPYGPFTTFIVCANDYLTYEGEIHLVQHRVLDENGGLHLRIHRNLQGLSATSASGVKYQVVEVINRDWEFNGPANDPAATTITFSNRFSLIGQGPLNNYSGKSVSHLTINANGEVTVNHLRLEFDCQ